MPAAMHSFYLRNMYQHNRLAQPGGITLAGVPIDLRKIKVPSFILASREDHIAPWKTVYRGTQLYSGPTRFVLAASGHIAGVINPPAANKYSHWTNDETPADPEAWLAGATEHPGSWWPVWAEWVAQFGGPKVAGHKPGERGLKPVEPAPGTYAAAKA